MKPRRMSLSQVMSCESLPMAGMSRDVPFGPHRVIAHMWMAHVVPFHSVGSERVSCA